MTTLLLSGLLAVGGIGRAFAGEAGETATHESESVTLSDLPAPAQKTLKKEAKGGKIEEVKKETGKAGEVRYEAEIVKNGKGTEIKVDEKGKVLERGKAHEESKEPEHEMKAPAPEMPAPENPMK